MKKMKFDRQDYAWSYVAIIAAGIVAGLFALILPLIDWARGLPLTLRVVLGGPESVDGAVDGVRATSDVVDLEFASAPTSAWLGQIGLGLLFTITVCVGLILLWRFMKSVEHGSPFTRVNVSRLRWMGAILLFAPLIAAVIQGLFSAYILGLAFEADQRLNFYLGYQTMALMGLGVVLICIAEVFWRGIVLEEDVEGLV